MAETHLEKIKIISDVIVAWVAVAGVLAIGYLALCQYTHHQRLDQVKQTMDFVDKFNDEDLIAARETYDEVFNDYDNQAAIKEAFGKDEKTGADSIIKLVYEADIEEDIATLLDFYDQLYLCVNAGLCDKDLAVRYFGKEAFDAGATLYPYIEKNRLDSRDPLVGEGILYFFKTFKLNQNLHKSV